MYNDYSDGGINRQVGVEERRPSNRIWNPNLCCISTFTASLIGAYITRPRCDPSNSNLSHRLLTSWRKNVWALGRSNSDNYDATFNASTTNH